MKNIVSQLKGQMKFKFDLKGSKYSRKVKSNDSS